MTTFYAVALSLDQGAEPDWRAMQTAVVKLPDHKVIEGAEALDWDDDYDPDDDFATPAAYYRQELNYLVDGLKVEWGSNMEVEKFTVRGATVVVAGYTDYVDETDAYRYIERLQQFPAVLRAGGFDV